LSLDPLLVKTATRKFDYVLRILYFSATCFLKNLFEGQVHVKFAMVNLVEHFMLHPPTTF